MAFVYPDWEICSLTGNSRRSAGDPLPFPGEFAFSRRISISQLLRARTQKFISQNSNVRPKTKESTVKNTDSLDLLGGGGVKMGKNCGLCGTKDKARGPSG